MTSEITEFKVSNTGYFLIVLIWLFSIGTIIVFHWASTGLPQSSLIGWVVYIGLFWAIPLFIGISSTWGFLQQMNTRFDETKVTQPRLKGMAIINWEDISNVTRKEYGQIWIQAEKQTIKISSFLYDNSDELYQFLFEKIHHHNQ